MTLAAPEIQEMNAQVEVTQRNLRTIEHFLMVHARVLEEYINFALMYTTYDILPVIPIKDLINEDGEPTVLFKLATGTKTQYHIYACYFFHVLYGKLMHTLEKWR